MKTPLELARWSVTVSSLLASCQGTEFGRRRPSFHARLAVICCALILALVGSGFGATLVVGPNINVTKSAENNSETFISINPTNPLNLFVTSTDGSNVFKYSTDGGTTWNNSNISGVLGGGSGGDQQSAWDNFGNLFVTYFAGASNHTVLALSTNGGVSFSLLVDTGALYDQPNVAVGPREV